MGCSWLGHLTADISFMWQGHLLKLRRHFVLGLRPAAPPLPHSSLPLGRTRADSERCFVKLWNEPINSQHWEFLEYFLSAALLCNTLKCRGKAWKLEIPKCSCLKKAWQQQGITLWKLAFVYFLFVCVGVWVCVKCTTHVQSPKKPQEGSRYPRAGIRGGEYL